MKTWTKPTLEVVNMNAEIGGYQPDFDDGPDAVEPRRAARAPGAADEEPSIPATDLSVKTLTPGGQP